MALGLVMWLAGCVHLDFHFGPSPGAKRLAITLSPRDVTAGVPLIIAVAVWDAQSKTVMTATDAITVSFGVHPPGATLLGTTTVRAVDGVATFSDLTIDKAGPGYTIRATAPFLTAAVSDSFTVTFGTASQLAVTTQPRSATAQAPISLAVTVQDAMGNLVSNAATAVSVAIGANPASGTLSGGTTVTAVNGVATFSGLTIDKPGAGYTLTVTGNGLTGATSGPFDVLLSFTTVSAGGLHTCGLGGGAAYCWGDNSFGQLGDGTNADRVVPVMVSGTDGSGLAFATLSLGYWHTCGVTAGGVAYCWGHNAHGELGNGTSTDAAIPMPVSGGLTFATVVAGDEHTCGLTTGGTAYCWGGGGGAPLAVPGGLTYASATAGGFHTCALTPDGTAYCWGSNSNGEMGNGTTDPSTSPVAVAGSLAFTTLSGGNNHTCGVTPAGAAYCWGFNADGRLGTGTTAGATTPAAVSRAITFGALSAGAGSAHTCATTPNGLAYCWGVNLFGGLGNGTTTDAPYPVPVSGGLAFAGVAVGDGHSCGRTAGGTVYCWGNNSRGELGNGTTSNSAVPVRVAK